MSSQQLFALVAALTLLGVLAYLVTELIANPDVSEAKLGMGMAFFSGAVTGVVGAAVTTSLTSKDKERSEKHVE